MFGLSVHFHFNIRFMGSGAPRISDFWRVSHGTDRWYILLEERVRGGEDYVGPFPFPPPGRPILSVYSLEERAEGGKDYHVQ